MNATTPYPLLHYSRDRRDKAFSMPSAHFHTYHELYFLIGGKTKYFVGSELYIMQPGDIMFIPKGEYHRTDSDESEGVERVLLSFNDICFDAAYKEYIDEFCTLKHMRIPKDSMSVFMRIFKGLDKEYRDKQQGHEEMKRMYVQQLLINLARYKQIVSEQELTPTFQLMQNAARYISANYDRTLSLEVLARTYSLSRGHFSKLFKKVTGVGVSEYITIARISAAQEMLSNGKRNITEVALACGFNDSNYFTRVFKTVIGMSPKQYAKESSR